MNNDLEDEQPLDPVMERVRRKMIRLQLVSVGIMLAGLLAVLFAIVFKVTNPTPSETDADGLVIDNALQLDAGDRIVSNMISGNRLVLEIETAGGAKRFIFVDTENGSVVGNLEIEQ